MNDSFTTAINAQVATNHWMDALAQNMTNIYTPGYRESNINFKTFLGGAIIDNPIKNEGQGKSTPGTSNENLFFEGSGYFITKTPQGKTIYTRHGEFTFDKEGIYTTKNGGTVQGYILNDKGEIMAGTKTISNDLYQETALKGGALNIPTTNIKMWIDPSNGKYLGKYEEFEFKDDGIIYGKADGGKIKTPLFKVAIINFNNPQELYEIQQGRFIETPESGRAIIGRGEVRGGLLEMSNVDFGNNTTFFQQAQSQKAMADQIIKTHKTLLQNTIDLMSQ